MTSANPTTLESNKSLSSLFTTCEGEAKRCWARSLSCSFQKPPDPNKSVLKIPFADGAVHLAPGTATGMPIGAEIAPADPSLVRTVRVRAEVCRGVDLAAAPPRGH